MPADDPAPRTTMVAYRLPEMTVAQIEAISALHHGLPATTVIVQAVSSMDADHLGTPPARPRAATPTPRKTYRLPAEVLARIRDLAAGSPGWTATAIIVAAVDLMHEREVGKKSRKTRGKSPTVS